MRIDDYFKVNDKIGPRGYVVFRKADGTVIFQKENMIVTEGRKYLRELFITNSLPSDFPYSNAYVSYTDDTLANQGYKLSKFAFGASGTATQLTDTTLESIVGSKYSITKEIVEASDSQMYVVFKASITPDTGQVFRELGLFLSDGSTDKLFSRVVFDPAPVEADETYELDYYLYF